MRFVDSHAHITADGLYEKVDEIIKNAFDSNVHTIINICTDKSTLQRGIELKSRFQGIYLAAAIHPHDAEQKMDEYFEEIKQKAVKKAIVAIGETGLDYHYEHSAREAQKHLLKRHLKLALTTQLPIIIHCREAFEDFFTILDQEYLAEENHIPGVLHCFTGNFQEAAQVIQRGWYLSLSGIVTFKKSDELREVAKMVPLDKLLIETDAPFLAPHSRRGKTNQPAYLPEIAQAIATAKGVSIETIAEYTQKNAYKLFNITNL